MFLQQPSAELLRAACPGFRFRSLANGWAGACGTVLDIEKDLNGNPLRVSLLRDGGLTPAWFMPGDLRVVE